MYTPVAPSPPPSSPPSGGGDDEEVVLSLTLAGVMLALGIVLQQLLHKKEVKWVTESSGVMVLGATFNAAWYLISKLFATGSHTSISVTPMMHDVIYFGSLAGVALLPGTCPCAGLLGCGLARARPRLHTKEHNQNV